MVVVPINSSEIVGWSSSKEPEERGNKAHLGLSRKHNLVIVPQLKLKTDPNVYQILHM